MHITAVILLWIFSFDLINFVNLSTTFFIQLFFNVFYFFHKNTLFLTFFYSWDQRFLHLCSRPQQLTLRRSLYAEALQVTVSEKLAQGPRRGRWIGIRTHDLPVQRHRLNQCATTPTNINR